MRRGILLTKKIGILILGSIIFLSCQKSIQEPIASPNNQVQSFHVSASKLVLLQGNESNMAVSFNWKQSAEADVKYTIEAAVCGSSFDNAIELMSTGEEGIAFSVKEFNKSMSRLIYANNTAKVEFRIREDAPAYAKRNPVYSAPVAMEVTTYRNYIAYDEQHIFKIPGNYQGWNISTAPKIVPLDNPDEYEGYIHFTNDYPQVLMVKGNQWETVTTYSYIGGDKFGFGGSVLSVFGGSGVYLFRANYNTHEWSYTKIKQWGIVGTAIPGNTNAEPVMKAEENSAVWSVTTDLVKGVFRIRANNSNTIYFGQKATDDMGVPSYGGGNIVIKQAGNYTIKLELQVAGNYAYSITKNS
ncbi:MAG: SusE domain-containing protein [Bacteroidota bacterium]